ncbi:MAG: hypothetical protein WBA41_33965 [Rivularia sp. (in: cyanobacteria)]
MNFPNDRNNYENKTITIFCVLAILIFSGCLGYVIGLNDRPDDLQQQKSEQQIEKTNKVN